MHDVVSADTAEELHSELQVHQNVDEEHFVAMAMDEYYSTRVLMILVFRIL